MFIGFVGWVSFNNKNLWFLSHISAYILYNIELEAWLFKHDFLIRHFQETNKKYTKNSHFAATDFQKFRERTIKIREKMQIFPMLWVSITILIRRGWDWKKCIYIMWHIKQYIHKVTEYKFDVIYRRTDLECYWEIEIEKGIDYVYIRIIFVFFSCML